MNSVELVKCEGCRHIKSDNDDFCYMFRHKPEVLPCGQHDKFAEIRKKGGELLRKNPILFMDFIKSNL
jgi:hypothetical protein